VLGGMALGNLSTHACSTVGGRRQLSQEHSARRSMPDPPDQMGAAKRARGNLGWK